MKTFITACLISALASSLDVWCTGDASYENIKLLQESILSPSNYSTTIRPLADQTQILEVSFSFSLVAIVSLDDVKLQLTTNGLLFLFWHDERSTWDPSEYGGIYRIAPDAKQIWRPRLLLINTLGERDLFKDDYSHRVFFSDGRVGWMPGGLFHTYCGLDLKKFPFDRQSCHIQLCPSGYSNLTLRFLPDPAVNMDFFFTNPGWQLVESNVTVKVITVAGDESLSCPTVIFVLERRPSTIVLNVILPVILLSLLNNLVFFIPVESGEKISYAVTVLLALAVFLSMVSEMTPQVTDTVPAISIYLFVLLVSSVVTVGAAIFTVYLHHKDEEKQSFLKSKESLKVAFNKVLKVKAAVTPATAPFDLSVVDRKQDYPPEKNIAETPEANKYRMISKHINKIFFVIVKALWLIITIWYFVCVKF